MASLRNQHAQALSLLLLSALAFAGCKEKADRGVAIWAAMQRQAGLAGLTIEYPLEGAVFPPEIPPPVFRWTEKQPGADQWLVAVQFGAETNRLFFLATERSWTQAPGDWETIKRRSAERPARVTVIGATRAQPDSVVSAGCVGFATSRDRVGAPLFYREVNLPFIEAVKDPSAIRWRFGPISSPQPPPVVLEHLPVCGNCHSFPRDGRVLAMDVDYGNNKASYIMTEVAEKMRLATNDLITWDSFHPGEGESTLGLLSQISPDGRYVVSTVKDQSVFVDRPGLEYSQLFFPVKGILAVYDRQSKTFLSLPGADDPRYVQSNPVWSPDGRTIVFARAPAHDLKLPGKFRSVLLAAEECREFVIEGRAFRYDLCRIPFNGGKGGAAEPLRGASGNGRSNFFPKFSPDGRWIVFCRANSYMLLQPDSEMWIVPAAGGTERKLRGNTGRMNSWHSWSPNSRWLAFSSKAWRTRPRLFASTPETAAPTSTWPWPWVRKETSGRVRPSHRSRRCWATSARPSACTPKARPLMFPRTCFSIMGAPRSGTGSSRKPPRAWRPPPAWIRAVRKRTTSWRSPRPSSG